MAKRAAESRASTQSHGERWTEQDARRVLDAWEKSGETVAAFAQRMGVIPQRLFWWRKRLSRATSEEPSVAFVPVTVRPADVASAARSAPVVVTLGDRVRVEMRDMDGTTAAWVAALVLNIGEARS
jgi:transposase-like protein